MKVVSWTCNCSLTGPCRHVTPALGAELAAAGGAGAGVAAGGLAGRLKEATGPDRAAGAGAAATGVCTGGCPATGGAAGAPTPARSMHHIPQASSILAMLGSGGVERGADFPTGSGKQGLACRRRSLPCTSSAHGHI